MVRWRVAGRSGGGTHDSEIDFAPVLDSVRGIRWPARSAVRSGIPGTHASRLRGTSAEFTEYRPYRQGDDLGRIDWKLFARTDRAYIRLSNDRAILPTTIVLDASASMAFPDGRGVGGGGAKWKLASELAIGLAAVARGAGDPVGLCIAHETAPLQLPPRTRHSVIHEMISAMLEAKPSGSAPVSPSLLAATRVSGRVVLITDFLGDAEDLLANAARAVAGSREVHAVHIVASEELDPSRETLLVADPERPDIRRPMTGDARAEYLTAFASWRDGLAHAWSDAGVSYSVAVPGNETPDHIVRRIATGRGTAVPG